MKEMLSEQKARQYSPLTLAFLGDSVYETMVRETMLMSGNVPVRKLHEQKIRLVCAGFQARAFEMLLPLLSEEELSIAKRGRNAESIPPKHADPFDYRKATGLEALFGYLYLIGNEKRLEDLFQMIWSRQNEFLSNEKE
ncbi:MAG: ribonuclease III domain-containing protein [Oscillospiraceae bacterium]